MFRSAPRIDPRHTINHAIKKHGSQGGRKRKGGGRGPAMAVFDLKPVSKALRRDCEAGNVQAVEAALSPGRFPLEIGPRLDSATLGPALKLLIRHGRLQTAEYVLQQRECDVGLDLLMQAIALMPQTSSIDPDAVISLVRALIKAAELNDDAYRCRSFLERQAGFVLLEFAAEVGAVIDDIASIPIHSLVGMGRAAVVTATPGRKPNEVVCNRAPGASDGGRDRRGLLAGDSVGVSPLQGGAMVEAEVVIAAPLILKMASVGAAKHLINGGGQFRVDKLANRIAYTRQLAAMRVLIEAMGGVAVKSDQANNIQNQQIALSKKKSGKQSAREEMRPSKKLATAIMARDAGMGAEQLRALCSSEVSPGAKVPALTLSSALNESQRVAVRDGATKALTLVQGPPGTGKTKVAISILLAWVRSYHHAAGPILATSDSNIAVDNLLDGLAAANVRVVRLGKPDMVRPELLEYCIDARNSDEAVGQNKEAAYEAKIKEIRAAQVVCATCIGIGSEMLERFRFSAVLVDEATQATESSTLVPLCRGAQQLVLLGDQFQLPPTVISRHPAASAGAMPLFTRLLTDGAAALMLDTQYRMHPSIAQLPSDLFYAGKLATGIGAADRPSPSGFAWPRAGWPVAFVNVGGSEQSEGNSKLNRFEVDEVASIIHKLCGAGLKPADIGVITPYAAQARALRRLISPSGMREESGGTKVGHTVYTL